MYGKVAARIESCAEIHDRRKKNEKEKLLIMMGLGSRNATLAGTVHRLALAFLRVGSFLTGRAPGGTVFGD